jgi:F-type H+-transporting ATPase subunit gamma
MPGQLKEVRNRIRSVISTQQITKAMKMVSAAKLRKAQDRIIQMRPYAQKLSEMLSNIISATEGDVTIDLSQKREINRALVVVMTSDRGLCGAFNSSINKTALQHIQTQYKTLHSNQIEVLCIGKKSLQFFRKHPYPIIDTHVDLLANLNFDAAAALAQHVMNQYTEKKYDTVVLAYSRFKNAATQVFTVENFLPIAKVQTNTSVTHNTDFIFEPEKTEIIQTLIPKILKVQFFRALLDTNASEHGARMTAMDKATENANEMLRTLRISYNRARQAAITTELSEIVAGAAALQSN